MEEVDQESNGIQRLKCTIFVTHLSLYRVSQKSLNGFARLYLRSL
jgi:hypothetical protein